MIREQTEARHVRNFARDRQFARRGRSEYEDDLQNDRSTQCVSMLWASGARRRSGAIVPSHYCKRNDDQFVAGISG
jgi:hypothetical protein